MAFTNVDWIALITFVVVGYAPVFVSSSAAKAPSMYRKMKKTVHVPTWVFSIAWMLLYGMVGVAAFLYWQTESTKPAQVYHAGLALLLVHQVLNAMWMPMFFGQGWIAAALAVVSIAAVLALAVCIIFFLKSAIAGGLLIPLLFWYIFAMYLNADAMYQNGPQVSVADREAEKLSA